LADCGSWVWCHVVLDLQVSVFLVNRNLSCVRRRIRIIRILDEGYKVLNVLCSLGLWSTFFWVNFYCFGRMW
jgi:hypothetical protein